MKMHNDNNENNDNNDNKNNKNKEALKVHKPTVSTRPHSLLQLMLNTDGSLMNEAREQKSNRARAEQRAH